MKPMDQTSPKAPRVYYGWYIVATFMFIALITTGARNAFGIFVIPMSEEFGWSRGSISFAAALGALLNGVVQPFIRQYPADGAAKCWRSAVVTPPASFARHG